MPKPRPAPARPRLLNTRQRRFVDAILQGTPPGEAAIAAGYSYWTASQSAYELARRPNVAAAIAAGRALQGRRLTREAAIEELARVAMSNVLDYASVRGRNVELDLSRVDRARAAGVRELTLDETYNHRTGETLRRVRVRMGPKLAALRALIPLLPSAAEGADEAFPGEGEGWGCGQAGDEGEGAGERAGAASAPDRSLVPPGRRPDGALMKP